MIGASSLFDDDLRTEAQIDLTDDEKRITNARRDLLSTTIGFVSFRMERHARLFDGFLGPRAGP